jgi:hypothetical protein
MDNYFETIGERMFFKGDHERLFFTKVRLNFLFAGTTYFYPNDK